jgi:hypothetical protein
VALFRRHSMSEAPLGWNSSGAGFAFWENFTWPGCTVSGTPVTPAGELVFLKPSCGFSAMCSSTRAWWHAPPLAPV